MNDPIIVTRDLAKRAWADVEPKIQWAFASGAAASFVLELAHAYGVPIKPILAQELPFLFAIAAGYIMPSVGAKVVTTKHITDDVVQETEAHTGASITTASIPVQKPAFTADPVEPTAVIPSSGLAAFVANRPAFAVDSDPNATEKLN